MITAKTLHLWSKFIYFRVDSQKKSYAEARQIYIISFPCGEIEDEKG